MTNRQQEVPLGSLLTRIKKEVLIQDFEKYQRLTIRMNNKGIDIRDELEGHLIGTKRQFVVHSGQFLLSKIDAMNGAFGIVPEQVSKGIITGNFWAYDVEEKRLQPKYFNYLTHTREFQNFCIQSSSGTTHRKYLQEDLFLGKKIILPTIDEQTRIVAYIESLAAHIKEAQKLRETADEKTNVLLASALFHIFDTGSQNWKSIPMPEAIEINDRQVDPRLPEYSNLPHISGENIESKTCRLLPYRTAEQDGIRSSNYLFSPNTILYSKIRPYLRKAVCVDFQGVCSADIYPIKVNNPELDIKFVMWSFVANPFSEYANKLSGRTRMPKLNRKQLFAFIFKYPPLDEQRHIVAYLDGLQAKVNALRELQVKGGEELSALMPSVLDRAFKGEL